MSKDKKVNQIPVTYDITKRLRQYRRQSGISALGLLKKYKSELTDIDAVTIQSWLNSYGSIPMTEKSILDKVCTLWEAEASRVSKYKTTDKKPITKEYIEALNSEIIRSGISPSAFIRMYYKGGRPLNAHMINVWLRGETQSADLDLLNAVLTGYKSLPKATASSRYVLQKRKDRVDISDKDLDLLLHYRYQLNITPSLICSDKEMPIGLSKATVSQWLTRHITTAVPEHLEWVLNRCFLIVDNIYHHDLVELYRNQSTGPEKRGQNNKQHPDKRYRTNWLIPLEDIALIILYRDTLGLLPTLIFSFSDHAPQGLSDNIVKSWLYKRVISAKQHHVDWVLRECYKVLENGYNNELVQAYKQNYNQD